MDRSSRFGVLFQLRRHIVHVFLRELSGYVRHSPSRCRHDANHGRDHALAVETDPAVAALATLSVRGMVDDNLHILLSRFRTPEISGLDVH